MSDVVSIAITNAEVNYEANEDTRWLITFTNNETRKGTLLDLGSGIYLLEGQRPYYFSASQVIYMSLSEDQS